nr:retrovirus-related Pol polyprotein from transposon TNT 1-94 [Tanacetum cinerariifolium]
MDTTIDQQVAIDEALVPHAKRLRFRRSNFLLLSDIKSRKSTLQLVYDVLRLYPFFKAFLVTADVPEIYMQELWVTSTIHHHAIRFKMDNKKHIVNLESFRDMLHICPRVPGQSFAEPPFKEEILAFIRFLGHSATIKKLTDVEHKESKKRNEMYYPRFTKVIIHHFMSNDPSIPRRNKFSALLPIELTNEEIKNSNAYKEYYAIATGVSPPKPKASVWKTRSSFNTTITPPTVAAGPRLTTSDKGKQTATASKAKSLSALSKVAMTEAQQLKLVTKKSLQQTHISQVNGSGANEGTGSILGVLDVPKDEFEEELFWNSTEDEDDDEGKDGDGDNDDNGDDGEEGDGDYDDDEEEGEDNEQKYDEEEFDEETRGEESFDPILKTPENSDDEGNGEEDLGFNVGREEGYDEEEEEDELYRDVNVNQGRGIQATLEVKDSHVTLTPVNPDGQQQSSSVSSQFMTSMLNPTLDVVKVAVQIQSNRLREEAQKNDEFLKTVDENMQTIIKDHVKEQVKVQVTKILPRIENTMNEKLEAEVLTRSSHLLKTSYAIAADLSEINLYKALVEAYESNKIILDTYGETITMKRRRDDDANKDEEPSARPDRGSKRRREGKEPESASAHTETATRSTGRGTSSCKYTTSIMMMKAEDYGHIKWIEDLVPRTMWIEEPIGYDKHASRESPNRGVNVSSSTILLLTGSLLAMCILSEESSLSLNSNSQMKNNIMATSSRDRPPMLAPGRYPQWRSRFLRYVDTRPTVLEHTTVKTPTNMSPKNKAHFLAEKEAIHLILTRIRDDIYSTVDACQTAQEMWEAIERLQQGESLNIQDVKTNLFWEFRKFTSHDGESMDMQKNLALIAKYFKKIYKPTNNNLETSSNSKNKNVDTTPRFKNDNQSGQFGNQRTVNVVAARENVGSKVVQQSGIQCFNYKEYGHFAKECRKPKRVKDFAYHKEKMLLRKQAKQYFPLQAEQYDWLAETNEEVQNEAGYNVSANHLQHSEQSKSVSNTCLVETDDSNVILDSPDMCEDDIQNEQNDVESDDERVALANLIANLKLNVDENKKIQKQLKKENTTLTQELKECKAIIAETSKSLGESISVRDSCLVALQTKQTEFEKYKAFNDRTVDYEKLERKLNEALGHIAYKDTIIREGLKTKAYELSVVKEKHDELMKQSLLTKSHYEGLVNQKQRLIPDGEVTLALEKESRSKLNKDSVRPYDYTKLNSLYEIFKPPTQEYETQLAHANEIRRKMWRKSFLKSKSNIYKNSDSLKFVHELKQEMHADLKYVESLEKEIDELESEKAEFSDMNISISELKKLIKKGKGKSMDTKFDRPSVVRQPNAQWILKPSVLGKPTPFSDSFERKYFPKTKSVPKANVSEGLSKPVTAQTLPQTAKKAVSNTNVLKPGMYRIDNRTSHTRAPRLPQTVRNTNPHVCTSTRVNHKPNVSRPHLKSNQSRDKVIPNNSQVKAKKTQVEVHPRIPSDSNKIKSVTACKDSLNSRTLNANAICATYDIQCAGSDHDHYQEAACAHHEDHMIRDSVQLDHVVDSNADYTSDSNIILYDQYVKDNEVPVVHSDVSSVPTDAFMMIYDDMCEPHDQSVSYPSCNIAVQNSLTAKLATYKEHVELFEQRAKFELTEREQKINKQLSRVISDCNFKEETLKKELHSIKLQLASTINHNKSKVEEVSFLKKDFKQRENKHLADFLNMKPLKEKVEDKLIKQDQSLQTVHMLCRPRPNSNELNRDTLEIAEITRKKMNDKMNDPECVTHKRITPTGLTDGERGFEQTKACYLQEVIPFFKTLKDNFKGIQKALTKEVKEMKDVFEELEAEVAQYVVDRKRDAIELKNLLIANDNLIAECLSQEVFCMPTNSKLNVARFAEMYVTNTTTETRCLALEAELANLRDTNNHDNQKELINHFSKLKVNHLNLQLKYKNLKDNIGNSPPTPDKDTPDFDFVFVIGKMKASLQGKDNVILQLKKQLSQLQVTHSDTDRTLRVQTIDSQITKLTDQVTHLQAQNDMFWAENDKIKQHYKELKKQVTVAKPSDKSDSTTYRHVVTVKSQKTNVLVPPFTGVNSCPNASGSQPKSHVKSNRISPAEGVNKLPVEDQTRTNKPQLRTSNRVDSSSRLKRTCIRTRSSSNIPGESSSNPTSSNPRRRNRRRSKQPFILKESPVDMMADQHTMAELLRTPTEGYAEAIVDLEAKYYKVKAKLALLSSSASAPSSSLRKNKGLIAETYDWDDEEISSNEDEVTKVKALMALTDKERVSVGKESAKNDDWTKISMKKVHTLLQIEDNDDRKSFLDYLCIDLNYVEEQRNNLLSKYRNIVQELMLGFNNDFQDSPDDVEDTRSSHEYLNDLKEE